ncbi:MAG: TonB-dependent receptor [Alphaproteobacteria bacterium]|nr:TonB-dependent receptor [Alphaproteobacteria bacterium]MBU1515346.1 TonB-dependent receptor [Alphaproteobacteria bacterium]MBU2095396.1 TonB-dependent receptor [Alphaproteobacteria bacterium]MBU2152584.1 TonB-dependent receptor [Alphaproteobacteria bacterium]MBU2309980.1 TonB-dependent receptor [Alphaproteobacteria bacterium]
MAAVACGVAAFGVGGSAEAASGRIRFHVEPQPYAEALLDVAQQANVTLIGAGACKGYSRNRLVAELTLEQALSTLLADAPCSWRVIAPGAVEISPIRQAEAPRLQPPVTVTELLVTATKRVRNARELAVAVTAIPRGSVEATGATDAGEAASQFAGVQATNLGPGRNKLLLRGLSDGAYSGRTRSTVATYLDDIPVNYNAPDPDLRLVDVERVEVARGPQGALFGAGSMSGVYRIVSRKPDLEEFSAEIRASGSLTKGGDPSGAIEGHVNYPLLPYQLGFRLSAYEEIQGGYLDDILQNRSNVDRTERRGARLIATYEPTDAWSVNLTLAGQHLRSDDTHYTAPGLGLKRAVRTAEPHVNDIELATATVKREWGWADLTSATGFVRHRYGSVYDSTEKRLLYSAFADKAVYAERTRTNLIVQDLFLTSRGAGPVEWLAGLYGSYTRVENVTEFLAQLPFAAPLVHVYGDDRRDNVREAAAYGEASYQFAPGWTVAIGGRVFTIDTRTKSDVVSEDFAPRSLDRTTTFSGFSPKLSVQWKFADGDLAYAVVSEGYRSGGVNSGGAIQLSPVRETFSPDRLVNYEAGLKLTAMSNRLSLNSAVFYAIWDDIQTDQFRTSGIAYTTNAGDARVLGLESELTYRAANGLSAQVNGRLSETKTSGANPDFRRQLVNGLPGAPAVSGGALLSYQRDLPGDWTLRLVGQATYVGKSRVTFDAAAPKMGGYARTRLSAEVIGQAGGFPVGVQVYVINPLDSFSDTFAFGNPFSMGRGRQITPQRPVTVGMTLSAAM